ncbi:MAG: thiol-disulfide isomerase, partial [Acidobacteriota bacterium]|nr:thiol-disulfide isomerase [Acidobacteriota bacterium]
MLIGRSALFLSVCGLAAAAPATNLPTYSKDIAPIVQQHCQSCHRPGEATPFSLTSYKEARPWASAIKEAVQLRKMPPWFADPQYGHFANDRTLPQKDIDTIVAWVSGGAPEGDPKDLPKPVHFVEGWNIGKPDLTVTMPAKYEIPASGTIDYQYVLIPLNLKKDVWIQGAEVRPGNRAVVHHVIAYVRPPGSNWMRDAQPGIPYVPKKGGEDGENEFLVGFAPGMPPITLPAGEGKLLRAGSDIVLQLHYTANGKAAEDRTTVGMVFAKEKPSKRVYTIAATTRKFAIPPGDPDYEVRSSFEFGADTQVSHLMPHMHLRGKDFEYTVLYPDGREEVILNVPKYDFNWQLNYEFKSPMELPKGTRIDCVAHYDNSPNNKYNPDPSKAVKWGDQTWEEMMIGWFSYTIP